MKLTDDEMRQCWAECRRKASPYYNKMVGSILTTTIVEWCRHREVWIQEMDDRWSDEAD